jgi:hypothetical protein
MKGLVLTIGLNLSVLAIAGEKLAFSTPPNSVKEAKPTVAAPHPPATVQSARTALSHSLMFFDRFRHHTASIATARGSGPPPSQGGAVIVLRKNCSFSEDLI